MCSHVGSAYYVGLCLIWFVGVGVVWVCVGGLVEFSDLSDLCLCFYLRDGMWFVLR